MTQLIEYRGKVVLYYSYRGKVKRWNTGVQWEHQHINENKRIILNIKQKIDTIINNYMIHNGSKPDVDYILNKLNEKPQKGELLENFKEFKSFKSLNNDGKPLTLNSLKIYDSLYRALIDFQSLNNYIIKYKDVNKTFLGSFQLYLSTIRKQSDHTINKRMKTFKEFLKYINENNIYSYDTTIFNFKIVKKPKITVVALTVDELKQLFNLSVPLSYRLTKDIFLIQCMTGLRYSDINRIRKQDINEGILKLFNKKTGTLIHVPINDKVLNILMKNEYKLNLSIQKFNKNIKDIVKLIPTMKEDITIKKMINEREHYETKQKWELISSHTGRRTFITHCINNGIDLKNIMNMTGHSNIQQLVDYAQPATTYNDQIKNILKFF